MKVLATIVSYNPDVKLLDACISSIFNQVDKLVVYDNHSANIDEICAISNKYGNVFICKNEDNIGLPINYNRAASVATEEGYDWLLLLDQDSVLPNNLIEEYFRHAEDENVAIICPLFRDVNLYDENEFLDTIPKKEISTVERCISSASLNRVSTILELGGFDEKMFIDWVDYDYCKNVVLHGYKILQVNNCIIEHRIGNSKKIKVLWKEAIAYNHAPIRKYYFFRNRIYFARKYHLNVVRDFVFFRNMVKHFLILFFEEDKLKKVHMALKGMFDGLKL